MGISLVRASPFMILQNSCPSISGMATSRMISWGVILSTIFKACTPFSAKTGICPISRIISRKTNLFVSTSSTTRTFAISFSVLPCSISLSSPFLYIFAFASKKIQALTYVLLATPSKFFKLSSAPFCIFIVTPDA